MSPLGASSPSLVVWFVLTVHFLFSSLPLAFHLFFGLASISVLAVTTGAGDKRTVSEVSDLCLCANRRAVAARKVQESLSENGEGPIT